MSVFDIRPAADEVVTLSGDERRGERTFSVTNVSGREIRARASLDIDAPAEPGWLSIQGTSEGEDVRTFDVDGNEQFTVLLAAPAEAPAGDYTYRLVVASTVDPDNDSGQSAPCRFAIEAPVVPVIEDDDPKPKPKIWPWILLGVILLLGVIGLIIGIATCSGDPLEADFTMEPAEGERVAPHTVKFTDNSVGGPEEWHWNFAGLNTAEGETAEFEFTEAGTYAVTLEIVRGDDTNDATKEIVVTAPAVEPPPAETLAATFTAVPRGGHLNPGNWGITVNDTSKGDPTSWVWDFGDGSGPKSGASVSHTYKKAGKFNIVLTVGNAAGTTAKSRPFVATVFNQMPNLGRKSLADAVVQLQRVGLAVGTVSKKHNKSLAENTVLNQIPRARSRVLPGAKVNLTVSTQKVSVRPVIWSEVIKANPQLREKLEMRIDPGAIRRIGQ